MSGVKFHGTLLLASLLWAFQTWTRQAPPAGERERVPLWALDTADVRAITYASENLRVHVTKRRDGDARYLWGVDMLADENGAWADTLGYPLGVAGDRLWHDFAEFGVLRDLGPMDDARRSDFGLEDADAVITIEADGERREVRLGDRVHGGGDRYGWDPARGRAFVVPGDVIVPLERGSAALRVRQIHRFADRDVASVRVEIGDRERVMERAPGPGSPARWTPPGTSDPPDGPFDAFMERVGELAIDDFVAGVEPSHLQPLVRVEYLDARGRALGFLALLVDPSDPEGARYILSEETHVPARAIRSLADRVEGELPSVRQ